MEEPIIFQHRNELSGHFVNTSKVLLCRYHTLSDAAKITYQVIDGYDWKNLGRSYPAIETLAEARNTSPRTIRRHINELIKHNLITRQRRRNKHSIWYIEGLSKQEINAYLDFVNKKREQNKNLRMDKNVRSQIPQRTKMSVPYTNEENEVHTEEQQQVVVAQLGEWKIGKRKAQQLAKSFSLEHISQKIELLRWKLDPHTKEQGQPITDQAAWLIRAIEQDYQPPPSFKPVHVREQEAEKKRQQRAQLQKQEQEQEAEANRQREDRYTQALAPLYTQYQTGQKEHDLWTQVCEQLKAIWLATSHLLTIKDGTAIITVPNFVAKRQVEGKLALSITQTLQQLLNTTDDIHVQAVIVSPSKSTGDT